MNLPFFIARRYLLRQKGTFSSFIIRLAILATSLSVATMLVTVAFVTGFKYEIREKLFSFWGHIHITPYTPNTATILTPEPMKRNMVTEQKVKAMAHVRDMQPFAVRPAIIKAGTLMEGIQLKGVTADYHLPKNVDVKGSPINYSDTSYSKEILLSQTTADRMNVKAGDDLQMYFLEPGADMPRVRKLKISGIYHTGMEEVDKNYAVCDIRLLQRINSWQADDINGYQVLLDDDQLSDTLADEIFNRYIEPPLTTNTMKQIFPNVFDWLSLQDVNTRVIIFIMSIVAIINLAVALLILIVEQSRMIGVLKAQGMPNSGIMRIFYYHAALIAGAGIVLGNIIGLGFCFLQKKTGFLTLSESTYYMKYAPVRILWWQPVLIDTVTLVLCILCMSLPALYIRRILPVRVLQFK